MRRHKSGARAKSVRAHAHSQCSGVGCPVCARQHSALPVPQVVHGRKKRAQRPVVLLQARAVWHVQHGDASGGVQGAGQQPQVSVRHGLPLSTLRPLRRAVRVARTGPMHVGHNVVVRLSRSRSAAAQKLPGVGGSVCVQALAARGVAVGDGSCGVEVVVIKELPSKLQCCAVGLYYLD